jgi:hypothetical protein
MQQPPPPRKKGRGGQLLLLLLATVGIRFVRIESACQRGQRLRLQRHKTRQSQPSPLLLCCRQKKKMMKKENERYLAPPSYGLFWA